MNTADTCVVVPAFNESGIIATTVSSLREHFSLIVVVDDGSRDDTADLARRAGAVVLRHAINRGQGAALQTGFDYVLERTSARFCVTFDADGQHRVEDAVAMRDLAASHPYDVVLASRFLGRAENMPPSRRLLMRAAVRFSRMTSGLPLTDTHNGLRVLSRRAIGGIHLRHPRMAYATELESAIASSGLPWTEAPTTVVYTDYSRAKGQTNSNAINILFDLALDRLRYAR